VVLCWGDNRYGQLGTGSTAAFSVTPLETAGGHRFTSISVGYWHACALGTDGNAWCWGGGAQGQVGDGSFGQPNVPVRVVAPVKMASVDAGGYFSCGIGVDGFTYCWGNNNNGELADGTTTNRATAVRVVAPPL
jgi:alpha-tubulin suppressor-like RCC1 family protein